MKKIYIQALLLLMSLMNTQAFALTVKDIKSVCNNSEIRCDEHPLLNAYIGGGLDLIASLAEETKYLGKVYCQNSEILFDAKSIIRFIENSHQNFDKQNAMLRFVAYFEKNGKC